MVNLEFEGWTVIDPASNFLGLPYGEWARNWVNWLIRADPDKHNDGPVVYLRGIDFNEANNYGSFVRLENERIFMSTDQALLCVMMACFIDVRHHTAAEDHDKRLSKAYDLVINGDHPPAPHQFCINGKPFVSTLDNHLIVTPEFKLHVPTPSYGSTLGQLLDIPLTVEGDWDCALAGYFILLKPTRPGKCTISSNATAEDGYHTETLVQVEVHGKEDNSTQYHAERMKETVRTILKAQGFETESPTVTNVPKKISEFDNLINTNHSIKKERKS